MKILDGFYDAGSVVSVLGLFIVFGTISVWGLGILGSWGEAGNMWFGLGGM